MKTKNGNILLDKALEQLADIPGMTFIVKENGMKKGDAMVTLQTGNKQLRLFMEVKNQLRYHQLNGILALNRKHHPLLAIAEYIEPKMKEALRKEGINYLETNGNMFLHEGDVVVWVDGRKYTATTKPKTGRAFTPTGLQLLFHFLLDEQLINLTYREIAKQTGIGFGNINVIITDLKEKGFLLPLTDKQYKLARKKELLDKWITGYQEKLRLTLFVDAFEFLDKTAAGRWKELTLPQETCWGGEPAADILTDYLHPEIFTLYTGLRKPELIKTLRLIPAIKGKIKIYHRFWNPVWDKENCAPPLLVYADLLINGDRRSRETAQKIFNAHLQNQFT